MLVHYHWSSHKTEEPRRGEEEEEEAVQRINYHAVLIKMHIPATEDSSYLRMLSYSLGLKKSRRRFNCVQFTVEVVADFHFLVTLF